ncbi:MAG: hypothetical protein ABI867_09155, partial [Kofleriaceae bacterium]
LADGRKLELAACERVGQHGQIAERTARQSRRVASSGLSPSSLIPAPSGSITPSSRNPSSMSCVPSNTRISGALRCALHDDWRSSSRKRDRQDFENTRRAHRLLDEDRGEFATALLSSSGWSSSENDLR